jgi:hypothetical protein
MKGYVITAEFHVINNKFDKLTSGSPGVEVLYDFKNYDLWHIDHVPNELFSTNSLIIVLWKCFYRDLEQINGHNQYKKMYELIQHRTKNKLPLKLIFDQSYEPTVYSKEYFEKNIQLCTNMGLNIKEDILFFIPKSKYNFQKYFLTYNIFSYNWPIVDAYFWKHNQKQRFTNLELNKRPNLVNLMVSKTKEKKWRADTVYEFYKNDLLPKTILSMNSDIDDFLYTNDKKFIKEIDIRIAPIGGYTIRGPAGKTNREIGGLTSDRTIFNNSRLSCILETTGPDGNKGDVMITTEKFFRSIVNYTPYILIGHPTIYDVITEYGFSTFDEFSNIVNVYKNIKSSNQVVVDAVKSVRVFLDNLPKNIHKIQELVNDNYSIFETMATQDYQKYNHTITRFLRNTKS